ncbi:unnamed protein product [Lota lota]
MRPNNISQGSGFKDFTHGLSQAQKSNTPENVAKCISGILGEYNGSGESDLRVTKDNAAVNVPCMAHTINLAVKEVLKPFKVATEALSTDRYSTAS